MHVETSGWLMAPDKVVQIYKYTQMQGSRDFSLEVHFDVQAGVSIHTFVSFLISDLDLAEATTVQVTLRAMEGTGWHSTIKMMAKANGRGGAVFGMASREDTSSCFKSFCDGVDMHFEVETVGGELLIKLPLPNDLHFRGAFDTVYNKIKEADDARGLDPIQRISEMQRMFGIAQEDRSFVGRLMSLFRR